MTAGLVIPFAALAFCTWAVYLGGLASLQAECVNTPTTLGTAMVGGVQGFSSDLPCSKVYRYWWFVMSIEIVTIIGAAVIAVTGQLLAVKNSFVGLFAICAILYIQASDSFLSLNSTEYYSSGDQEHRARTVTAGAIMTATANCLMVIVLGITRTVVTKYTTEKPIETTTATAV